MTCRGGGILTEEFISAQDRIISASIEIISDSGLGSLSFRNISLKTNINEAMVYKYFQDTDEILIEIVKTFFRFDKSIFKTIISKDISSIQKVELYIDAFCSYYNSYYSLSSIILQYEELLHNTHTRELIETGYVSRRNFLINLFEDAKNTNELNTSLSSSQLADNIIGYIYISTLNRRVAIYKKSLKDDVITYYNNWIKTIKAI